tara:strand:- start:11558 stop:12271 length:714 start_codon:yes stop_codon:yes gene_type:complete
MARKRRASNAKSHPKPPNPPKRSREKRRDLQTTVKPKNIEQKDLFNALRDDSTRYIAATGLAGSGKTFIATHYAMEQLMASKVDKIVLLRSVTQIAGEEMGFLPGSVEEKLQFFLQPMIANLKKFSNGRYEDLYNAKKIEIAPLAMIRGMSFENKAVLVDECQNVTSEIFKALLTRVDDTSKLIMMGDYKQNDKTSDKTDFEDICERLDDMDCFEWIELTKSVRSKNIQEILRRLGD